MIRIPVIRGRRSDRNRTSRSSGVLAANLLTGGIRGGWDPGVWPSFGPLSDKSQQRRFGGQFTYGWDPRGGIRAARSGLRPIYFRVGSAPGGIRPGWDPPRVGSARIDPYAGTCVIEQPCNYFVVRGSARPQ